MKDKQKYRYKPAGGLLAGFFFVSLYSYMHGIVRAAYVRQNRQKGIVQYAQNGWIIFMQFFCWQAAINLL